MPSIITSFFLSHVFILLMDILAIFLAFLVFRDNPRGKTNKVYLIMILLMLNWVTFAYLPRVIGSQDYTLSLLLLKIAWFVTPLFFSFLYLLSIYLIGKEERYRTSTFTVIVIGVVLSSLIIGEQIIAGFEFVEFGIIRIIYGNLMIPFLFGISLIITATLIPLFKERIISTSKKNRYYLVGLLIFYIFNIVFNIILPIFFDISRFYFLGDYSTLLFLGFTAYAILRFRLMDIRVAFRKSLIYGVSAFFVVSIYAVSVSYLEFTLADSQTMSLLIAPVVLLIGFELIKRSIRDFVDRYVHTDVVDFSARLDFGRRFLRVRGELDEWFASFTGELRNKLPVRDASMFLHDRLNGDIVQMFPRNSFHFDERADVIEMLSSIDQPVFLSDILRDRSLSNSLKGLFHRLQKEGDVMVPLSYYGRFLGFILLRIESGRVDVGAVACCDKKYSYKLNDIVETVEKYTLCKDDFCAVVSRVPVSSVPR